MFSPNTLVKVKSLSHILLFETLWTVAYQAPPSMGFSRQEYWSGLPFPSPGDLPDPGIEPGSPALRAEALISEPPGKPWMVNFSRKNFHVRSHNTLNLAGKKKKSIFKLYLFDYLLISFILL